MGPRGSVAAQRALVIAFRLIGMMVVAAATVTGPGPAWATEVGGQARSALSSSWVDPYADGDSVYVPAVTRDNGRSDGREQTTSTTVYEEKRTPSHLVADPLP